MLTGTNPFSDEDSDMKTYQNIIKGTRCLSEEENARLSADARSLTDGFLTVRLAYRLGYLKGGAADIVSHEWFSGFDWDGLLNMTMAPPWRPKFKSAEDTQFFEEDEEEEAIINTDNEARFPFEKDLEEKWSEAQELYNFHADHSPTSSPSMFRRGNQAAARKVG